MHSEHKIGAVKIRTLEDLDGSSSAMLELGQQLPRKTYAPRKPEHEYGKSTADKKVRGACWEKNINHKSNTSNQQNKRNIRESKSTEMSTRKGNNAKKGQKYQNAKAFKNNLHDTSKATKEIKQFVGRGCLRKMSGNH